MKKTVEQPLDILSRMYHEYAPSMLFYARRFVDYQTAEDMVHDVFVKIWTQPDLPSPDSPTLKSYLLRAVHNACLDCLKHQAIKDDYAGMAAQELKIEELMADEHPENQYIDSERVRAIHGAIERLPEKCREIFKLSYLEEKKSAEIAAMLQISVRTVEAQLYRGLKTLRTMLKNVYLF